MTRPIPASAVDALRERFEVQVYPRDSALKPPQLGEACREVAGLLAVGVRVNEEVLGQAPQLKAVANCGVGYDNIDVEACTRRGIVVTNTPGVLTDTTADLAFALLMGVARRTVENDHYVRAGKLGKWEFGSMWGLRRLPQGHRPAYEGRRCRGAGHHEHGHRRSRPVHEGRGP